VFFALLVTILVHPSLLRLSLIFLADAQRCHRQPTTSLVHYIAFAAVFIFFKRVTTPPVLFPWRRELSPQKLAIASRPRKPVFRPPQQLPLPLTGSPVFFVFFPTTSPPGPSPGVDSQTLDASPCRTLFSPARPFARFFRYVLWLFAESANLPNLKRMPLAHGERPKSPVIDCQVLFFFPLFPSSYATVAQVTRPPPFSGSRQIFVIFNALRSHPASFLLRAGPLLIFFAEFFKTRGREASSDAVKSLYFPLTGNHFISFALFYLSQI